MKKGIFRKAGVAALSALTMATTAGLIPFAAPASAQTTDGGIDCTRIFGGTRFETAIAIAEATFGTNIPTVLIARGDGTEQNPIGANPDSLSGAPLAGQTGDGAPIILVRHDEIPDTVAAALERWNTQNAIILGGPVAVNTSVEAELNTLLDGEVRRVFGPTRYHTAAEIADEVGVGTLGGETSVFLANGETFVDALAVSPEAYAAQIPILLTPPNELHEASEAFIEENNVQRVWILGGPVAVSSQVEADVATLNGATTQVTRVFGGTAEETAVEIAEEIAFDELGWDLSHFNLANRAQDHLVDSLTGGPHGGEEEAPTLLASGTDTLGTATENFLEAAAAGELDDDEGNPVAGPESCHLLGGPLALSEDVEEAAEAAATPDEPAFERFSVTPEDETNFVGQNHTVTATVLDENGDPVADELVDFFVTPNDDTAFENQDADATLECNTADAAANGATETSTGSQPCEVDIADPQTDQNGEVTFTFSSTEAESFRIHAFTGAVGDEFDPATPPEFSDVATKTFVAEATALDANPEDDLNPFGTQHTVTATLVNEGADATVDINDPAAAGNDDNAAAGGVNNATNTGSPGPATVRFEVYRQAEGAPGAVTCPDAADADNAVTQPTGTLVTQGEVQTDENGQATFTYTGPNDPNAQDTTSEIVDCILVYVDQNGDDRFSAGEEDLADVVQKRWSDEDPQVAAVDAEPEQDTNPVSTRHTVTATVVDQFGNPVAGQEVRFDVFRQDAAGADDFDRAQAGAVRTTNAEGVATFSYVGPADAANDVIVVCTDDPGTTPADETDATCGGLAETNNTAAAIDAAEADPFVDAVEKFWVETVTAADTTNEDACVLAADTENNTVDVQDGTENQRFTYDAGDDFVVDGQAVEIAEFEENVTAGDRIQVNFNPNGVSTFTLVNDDDCTGQTGEESTDGTVFP